MSAHAFFSPSAAHRWLNCPGSMAFPENQEQGESSTFADDGTASHEWAAECLKRNVDADSYIGAKLTLNGKDYEMDDDRARFVQVYLDDVRSRASGGILMVEQRLDLQRYFGEGQFGTGDACIIQPEKRHAVIEDLKYGVGEKVYAERNAQGLSYALGLLEDCHLIGYEIDTMEIVICQPRLGHIDSWTAARKDLERFSERAQLAIKLAGDAMVTSAAGLVEFLSPDAKTCRWCRAKSRCPALAAYVRDEVRADFDDPTASAPLPPVDNVALARAATAVPLVEQWCASVKAELLSRVASGQEIVGPDGKPFKMVEGKQGDRKWRDETAAEAALTGVLADKAYQPRKILTAAGAAKVLDKKATKETWNDVFVPLISRAPGKPVLALGSDERPAYSGAAGANEFEEIE